MKLQKMVPWLLAGGFLAAAGLVLLFTPGRFSGGLLIAVAALTVLWGALRGKKLLRRILAVFMLLGFLLFAAAEIRILRYAVKKDDSPVCAVIVLGAGVYGTTPSLSLLVRLEAALDYAQRQPGVPIVVSGGQGPGEDISEARCMYDWLTEHGVAPERILMEDLATDTKENLEFSAALLSEAGIDTTGNIAVVSADYHLYRASLYWGLPSMVPVAAKMPLRWLPLTVNYFIREAFGVVYLRIFGT